jgi:hypothetical protein
VGDQYSVHAVDADLPCAATVVPRRETARLDMPVVAGGSRYVAD